jgi:hypothetical protein
MLYVNSFLLGEKKHGCDTKPCKHDAKCIQDKYDKDKYTCTCVGEYHGKNCELKTGCNSKPCKKGTCKNDLKDPSKFHCTCDSTHVGEKCDHEHPCLGKNNPCKSGQCSVDPKTYKAACSCPPGYTSAKCDKKNCTIIEYHSKEKRFEKNSPKLYVDKSIEDRVLTLEKLASTCKVKLHVLKSFVLSPKKEYKYNPSDSTHLGHYIGEAMAVHIYDDDNKLLCNEVCLGKTVIPNAKAKCFIDGLYAIQWKWSSLNPTVLAARNYMTILTEYNKRREEVQVGCSDKKF